MYIFIIGTLMGIANLIPGVSGGTIALLGGIYNRFISALADFTSFKFDKREVFFILKVVIGIGTGIIAFSKLMEMALIEIPGFTYGIFAGLVVGGLPVIRKKIKGRSIPIAVFFFSGITLVIVMTILELQFANLVTGDILAHSAANFSYDILAGFFGAAAMVLPGLSGAFVLLIMGEYHRVISALNNMDVIILLFVAIGVILGIALIARLLKVLLKRYWSQTFSFLFGLMVGSLPGLIIKSAAENRWIQTITGLLIGALLSVSLSKMEGKSKQ